MTETDDLPETPLDLSEYKTPHGAAKALARYLREMYDAADGVAVYRPEEAAKQGRGEAWTVSWEGGPFEWSIALTGGESLVANEIPPFRGSDPEVVGFYENDNWTVEPHYKSDLQFFDN